MSSSAPTIDANEIRIVGDLVLSESALRALAALLVDAAMQDVKVDPETAA